jgi:hypothetical protein
LDRKKPKRYLVEFRLDLRRLYHIFVFWVRVLLNGHCLVILAIDSDTQLEVGGDFRKVVTVRIAHYYPFVKNRVLRLEVNKSHIKLVVADELVLEHSLVHHSEGDLALLQFSFFFVLKIKEYMLIPSSFHHVINALFGGRVFLLVHASYFYEWIYSVPSLNLELFGLFDVNVDHVVSSLHRADFSGGFDVLKVFRLLLVNIGSIFLVWLVAHYRCVRLS